MGIVGYGRGRRVVSRIVVDVFEDFDFKEVFFFC